MIQRHIENQILNNLDRQKVGILLGSRRVGKTSLLKKIFKEYNLPKLWLNGEDNDTKKVLANQSIANYKNLLQDCRLLIIDEAQHIPEIGNAVKLMVDEIEPLHIIITGSSAFDIAQQGYPLVGRSITYHLFSIAQQELSATQNNLQTLQQLEDRLVHGSYPEIFSLASSNDKKKYLTDLINTYLLKDILEFENVKSPALLRKLLELLAWQIGGEVSETELGNNLGISKNTVTRYLDLLQKVFIIFPLKAYSGNLRKEVNKSRKWYFYDIGVRNAIINNFSLIATRRDIGQLWENYIISERQKINNYTNKNVQPFFWRTYDKQEIDYIETGDENMAAFEIKWKSKKAGPPIAFSKAYPQSSFSLIHNEEYIPFITAKK